MLSHEYQKRVRYGETDKMGYLYYGHYLKYYEIGRVELLRSLGLTYQEMEDEIQVMMPVVHAEVRYLRPAYYDNLITIRTTIRELPEKYIVFHMELLNEAGKLINTGRVRLCFVDMNSQKTLDRPPPALLDRMKSFFD